MKANRPTRADIIIINLLTSGIAWAWPVLLSLVVAPILVRGLGNDSYGIRGLTSAVVGYFALLELGFNAAVTKYLAEYIAKKEKLLISELIGTTLSTYAVIGLIGGVVIWSLAEWLSNSVFSVPTHLKQESVWAFRITGIGFFFSMLIWWGSAIPAGVQRFDIFNGISIGFGTLTSVGSLLAVWFGFGLLGVIWASVLANILTTVAYFVAARKLLPDVRLGFSFETKMFKRTAMFGLYMALFRLFALVFSQTDRLLVGGLLGPGALTFYIIPHQLASFVHQINAKTMQIIFPMASELWAFRERGKLKKLFLRGMNLSFVVGLSVALPLFVLAKAALIFWMSPEIAEKSALPLQILTIMYFLMGLTALPSSVLSGMGFPQVPAIASVITGMSSLLCYWLLINSWGINGVALGSLIGMIMSIVFYGFVSKRLAGISLWALGRVVVRPLIPALLIGFVVERFLVVRVTALWTALVAGILIMLSYSVTCWLSGVLSYEEKRGLLSFALRFFPPSNLPVIKDSVKREV